MGMKTNIETEAGPKIETIIVRLDDAWGTEGGIWTSQEDLDDFLKESGWEDDFECVTYDVPEALQTRLARAINDGLWSTVGFLRWLEKRGYQTARSGKPGRAHSHRIEKI